MTVETVNGTHRHTRGCWEMLKMTKYQEILGAEKIQVLRHFQHFPASACASKGAFLQRCGDRFFGSQGSGSLEDFDGFCEFLQFLSTFFRNRELGASPAGILGDFIKQNEGIWSRPEPAKSGGEPKTLNFLYFY